MTYEAHAAALNITEQHYTALFEALPGNATLVKIDAPVYTILAATSNLLKQTGRTRESIIGRGTFEAFPGNEADSADTGVRALKASFERVIAQKEPHTLPVQRYDMQAEDGSFSEHYWRASNSPVFGANCEVAYIVHSTEDITHEIKAREQEEKIKDLEQAYGLFMQAPFAIHIFTGPELVVDLANPPTLELWGRTEDPTGQRFLDVLPELRGQGYEVIMQEVMQTGMPKSFYEVPLRLNRAGEAPTGYFNFVYQPYYKAGATKANSVLVIANEVTQQVLTRQQASESEQSLRLAVEIAQLGVFNVDFIKGVSTYSQQVQDWFGYEAPVLPLSQITTRIHPDDRARVDEAIERSIAGEWNGRHNLVYRVLHPQTGAAQYLRSIGQVLFDEGKSLRISGIIQDITKEVTAQKALEESQARLNTIVEQTPAPTLVLRGDDFRMEYINGPMLAMMGRGEEVVGKPMLAVMPELEGGAAWEQVRKVYAEGSSFDQTEILVPHNRTGTPQDYYYNVAYRPLTEGGRTTGVIQVAIDVTEQVASRKKLEEGEERYRTLLEETTVATAFYTGPEIRIQYANATMLRYWGKGREVIGKTFREALPELESQPFPALLEAVYATGEPYTGTEEKAELEIDGKLQPFYFNFTYKALRDAEGRVYAVHHTAVDVTEQVEARKNIQESESRFRNLVRDASAAIVVLTGAEMKVEVANEAFGKLIGRTPEELMEQPLFDVIPETEAYYRPICEQVRQTGEPLHLYDSPYTVAANGKQLGGFLQIGYQAYRDAEGAILGVMIICQDVTESVTAKKALEQSQQELQLALDAGKMGTFVWHPQKDHGEPDERMLRLFGLSPSSTLNLAEALGSMIHPDDGPRYNEEVKQALDPSGTGVFRSEFRVIHPDQSLHWLAIHGQTYFDAETKVPVRMSGMAADITVQMQARKRLEESETRFRTLVEEAPVAMFIFRGKEMVISTANKMALQMIRRAEEVVGKPLLEAIPELTGSPAYRVFQEVYQSGQAQYGQEVLVPLERNGGLEDRYFNFAYTPLFENGQVAGVMDVAIEVTDMVLARKRIEEVVTQRTKELAEANQALVSTNKELQRSNANLEEFAHAASHDLKEPVRKITFFTNQLKTQLGDRLQDNEIRSFGRIENASERMGNLIDDLLLYSHVSQRPHETEAVDLAEKVKRVLEDLELDIEEKRAVVHVGTLPVVQGYKRQLQQLFQNLISNALKYSRAHVPPVVDIKATLETVHQKPYHLISVQDNGIGFEQEYADKIFQMFARLHGKAEYSGTGVGLSIVKKVVENHHGFIAVDSTVGQGSVFKIYIPV